MTAESLKAFIAGIIAQHRELHQLVCALREALGAGAHAPWTSAAIALAIERLSAVQSHLVQHIAQEERGGYLEESLAFAPRLHAQVRELMRQHPALLGQINDRLAEARGGQRYPARWPAIAAKIERTLQELLAHEAEENVILQEGFDTDLDLNG